MAEGDRSFKDYIGDITTNRPDWVGDISEYRTPEEDWNIFASTMQPFWSVRAPMGDVRRNLESRYLLAAPTMASQGYSPTFQKYLQAYPNMSGYGMWGEGAPTWAAGYNPQYAGRTAFTQQYAPQWNTGTDLNNPTLIKGGVQELRERARMASEAATSARGPYLQKIAEQYGLDSPEFLRSSWYSDVFGTGEGSSPDALQNQFNVAAMLATQRPQYQVGSAPGTGYNPGMYRGRMANAIRSALARTYQQRINVGQPKESFLDWYLENTGKDFGEVAPEVYEPGNVETY